MGGGQELCWCGELCDNLGFRGLGAHERHRMGQSFSLSYSDSHSSVSTIVRVCVERKPAVKRAAGTAAGSGSKKGVSIVLS